jgi:integrase
VATPKRLRDRALLAVLAHTGVPGAELTRLRVKDYKQSGGHCLLEVRGKAGNERSIRLRPEAVERLGGSLDTAGMRGDARGAEGEAAQVGLGVEPVGGVIAAALAANLVPKNSIAYAPARGIQ